MSKSMTMPIMSRPARQVRNKILVGDAMSWLKRLQSNSVSIMITSPPYFGLRSYVDAQDDNNDYEDVEPLIWDEPITPCEHAWGVIDPLRRWTPGDIPGPNSKINVHRSVAENRPGKESWFCNCGAWKGHLGNEPNPDLFIKHLCDIFEEAMRVLRDDGSLWVNLGDSYAKSGGAGGDWTKGSRAKVAKWKQNSQYLDVLPKSNICIPERFVVEMTTKRGWVLRCKFPWVKDAPMPNSQNDRDTVDFEMIYFFTKKCIPRYYTNVKTLIIQKEKPLGTKGVEGVDWHFKKCERCKGKGFTTVQTTSTGGLLDFADLAVPRKAPVIKPCKRCKETGKVKASYWYSHHYFYNQQLEPLKKPITKGNPFGGVKMVHGDNPTYSGRQYDATTMIGKIARTTWRFDTSKYKGKHHATFPDELPRRCMKRGCPELICSSCGLPMYPILERRLVNKKGWCPAKKDHTGDISGSQAPIRDGNGRCGTTIGKYKGHARCTCNAPFERPIGLDMFSGRGTTAKVLFDNNIDYIGIEINPAYAAESRKYIGNQTRLF